MYVAHARRKAEEREMRAGGDGAAERAAMSA